MSTFLKKRYTLYMNILSAERKLAKLIFISFYLLSYFDYRTILRKMYSNANNTNFVARHFRKGKEKNSTPFHREINKFGNNYRRKLYHAIGDTSFFYKSDIISGYIIFFLIC